MSRARRRYRRLDGRFLSRYLYLIALFAALIALVACVRALRERERLSVLAAFSLTAIPENFGPRDTDAVLAMRGLLAGAEEQNGALSLTHQSLLFARYFEKKPPDDAGLALTIAQLRGSVSPNWLTRRIAARAERVQGVLEQALYGGETNATRNEIIQLMAPEIAFPRQPFLSPIASFCDDWTAYVSSEFGERADPAGLIPKTVFHAGIDIAPPEGTDILAVADGTVLFARRSRADYGNHIAIDHGGVATLYAHCDQLYVRAGDSVKQGQLLASVGESGNATGPHLHFEVIEGGRTVNPRRYLPHAP